MTNLAAIIHGLNDIRMENIEVPTLGDNEVLLRDMNIGLCGTDIHFWKVGALGEFRQTEPLVIGHEAAGIVTKCGKNVKTLKIGDRVAVEPGISCRRCVYCKRGDYHLCPITAPPIDGCIMRYYKHDVDFLFKLPDHVSLEEGAILEPLSIAVNGCLKSGVKFGSKVLICGSGSIGLLSLLAAKAMGAAVVCVTDIRESKLEKAKELGADLTLNVKTGTAEELGKEVAKLMDGQPEVSIECSGTEAGVRLSIFSTKPSGCVALVGIGPVEMRVPIMHAATRDVDIRGVFRCPNLFPMALEMLSSGRVNVKPLITHRFKLEETLEAFDTALSGEAIKVMIAG